MLQTRRSIQWRSNLCSRANVSARPGPRDAFAAARARHAGGNRGKAHLHPGQRLLNEWSVAVAEPRTYCLGKLPEDIALNDPVGKARMRSRTEPDNLGNKRELGLGY